MSEIALKSSIVVVEVFEYKHSQMAEIAPELSTTVKEMFGYQLSHLAEIALKLPTINGNFLNITRAIDRIVYCIQDKFSTVKKMRGPIVVLSNNN